MAQEQGMSGFDENRSIKIQMNDRGMYNAAAYSMMFNKWTMTNYGIYCWDSPEFAMRPTTKMFYPWASIDWIVQEGF